MTIELHATCLNMTNISERVINRRGRYHKGDSNTIFFVHRRSQKVIMKGTAGKRGSVLALSPHPSRNRFLTL